ncbi:hypothetical protein, partial [Curtobacterium sp. P97]|uniref:hypothetical protein n=1 Tax=Curtobacterium sp. P97 TaxID=2939562 RepID=UPI00203E6022
PIGVLRTAAHHQLITRPWQALPDDVAAARWNLHLRADLTDLDHHGPLLDPASTAQPDPHTAADPAHDPEAVSDADVDVAAKVDEVTETEAEVGIRTSPGNHPRGRHLDAPDDPDDRGGCTVRGSEVGFVGGLPVSPVAVAELLARFDA